MEGAITLHEDALLRIVTRKNLMVAVWSDAPRMEQVRAFERGGQHVTRNAPGPCALASIVVSGVPNFPDPVRQALLDLVKSRTVFQLGTAHVLLVDGLAGAAVRAFLSTMILLARSKAPVRVFGERAGALVWLGARLREGNQIWSSTELGETLDEATKRPLEALGGRARRGSA